MDSPDARSDDRPADNRPADDAGGHPRDAFVVADLVAYQDDSIVSRTLVDEGSGTQTAFALDAGQRISEHSAPHTAVLHVVDGTGVVTIGDERYELGAGEALVLPPDEPHAVEAESRFKMLLSMFR